MNPILPDGAGDDSLDPVALPNAALELEVYQHERPADTDLPSHKLKSKRPAYDRTKEFFNAVYYWVIAR
ncbi:MAG: hypothetical protein QM813_25975 [Verrucomicrobiota bacterium]